VCGVFCFSLWLFIGFWLNGNKIMFLSNFILGGIEDQVGIYLIHLWKGNSISFIGAPFGSDFGSFWQSNEPIFTFFYRGLASFFSNIVLFTNLFVVASAFLTFVVSLKLFRYLKLDFYVSTALALIFTFSSYFYMHVGIHPQLLQIWLLPLFMIFLFSWMDKIKLGFVAKESILLGLILGLAVLISNYLGYFLLLFFACFVICSFIVSGFFKFKSFALNLALMFGVFSALVSPFLLPYVKANYLEGRNNPFVVVDPSAKSRALEDFQNFSSRPWYFILPPLGNPWLGRTITGPVLKFLKEDWGYFLADDYFPKEHGADYLGIINLLLFITAAFFAVGRALQNLELKIGNFKQIYDESSLRLVSTLCLTIFLLFLFTFPPFFTVGGHKVYTLGFVLYKLFPMFRVTARLGVVILLCVLIVNGTFLSRLFNHLRGVSVGRLIILACLLFTLLEFYVPISIFDTSKVPAVYEYLSKVGGETTFDFVGPNGRAGHYTGPDIVAVYPSGRAEDVYWITIHKKGLINPRMYGDAQYGFSSEVFTKELPTRRGLDEAKSLGVSYVVFWKGRGDFNAALDFFKSNLHVEKEFSDSVLFKL